MNEFRGGEKKKGEKEKNIEIGKGVGVGGQLGLQVIALTNIIINYGVYQP